MFEKYPEISEPIPPSPSFPVMPSKAFSAPLVTPPPMALATS